MKSKDIQKAVKTKFENGDGPTKSTVIWSE